MSLPMQNVYIFGAGKSGVSAARALCKKGYTPKLVSQNEPSSWNCYEELISFMSKELLINQSEISSEELKNSSLIVISPGIPRDHPLLVTSLKSGVPIWSEIELGFRLLSNKIPIIAITGTNGKTTVVTMIGEMIKNSELNPFVGGNIGIPFCDIIEEEKKYDVIVLELSSFQLESIDQFTPDVASILNITPNHGERYKKVKDYANAKLNITNNMSADTVLIGFECFFKQYKTIGPKKNVLTDNSLSELKKNFSLEKFNLVGKHNCDNLLVAVSAVQLVFDKKCDVGIQKTINSFLGVDFRLQRVFCTDYIVFNDAKSTNWDATNVAINSVCDSFPQMEIWVVIGGKKRGRGDSIKDRLFSFSRVNKFILIGETSLFLKDELEGNFDYKVCNTIENVKSYMASCTFSGVLLFSPAFPSFDQFKNYVERGKHFKEIFEDS
jgi:UDP-N-acetylmuramoylalanine--D-glutamate ligase